MLFAVNANEFLFFFCVNFFNRREINSFKFLCVSCWSHLIAIRSKEGEKKVQTIMLFHCLRSLLETVLCLVWFGLSLLWKRLRYVHLKRNEMVFRWYHFMQLLSLSFKHRSLRLLFPFTLAFFFVAALLLCIILWCFKFQEFFFFLMKRTQAES